MRDRLFLVDGMAFAFRSYYAIRAALTDEEGNPRPRVYALIGSALKDTERGHAFEYDVWNALASTRVNSGAFLYRSTCSSTFSAEP